MCPYVMRNPGAQQRFGETQVLGDSVAARGFRPAGAATPQPRRLAGIEDDERWQPAERGKCGAGQLAVGEHQAALARMARIEKSVAGVMDDVESPGFELGS